MQGDHRVSDAPVRFSGVQLDCCEIAEVWTQSQDGNQSLLRIEPNATKSQHSGAAAGQNAHGKQARHTSHPDTPHIDHRTADRSRRDRGRTAVRLRKKRLAEQDLLRPDVTVDDAAYTLWLVTSFDAFDLLYTGRSLPVDEVARLLIAAAERAICR
jgi:hypothetical protein